MAASSSSLPLIALMPAPLELTPEQLAAFGTPARDDSLFDVAKAVGIPTGAGHNVKVDHCPFVVGDVIVYPEAPGLAFRIAWRRYSYASATKPARWVLGLEQAEDPLAQAPSPPDASSRGR